MYQIDKKRQEVNVNSDLELLKINGTALNLTRNKVEEIGLLHFLPYSNMLGMNFYIMNKDVLVQIIPGIYKLENDQLIICLNDILEKRPDEFLSTAENQFVLAYYNKTVANG